MKDIITVNEFVKLFDKLVRKADEGNIVQEIIKYNGKEFSLVIYNSKEINGTFTSKI